MQIKPQTHNYNSLSINPASSFYFTDVKKRLFSDVYACLFIIALSVIGLYITIKEIEIDFLSLPPEMLNGILPMALIARYLFLAFPVFFKKDHFYLNRKEPLEFHTHNHIIPHISYLFKANDLLFRIVLALIILLLILRLLVAGVTATEEDTTLLYITLAIHTVALIRYLNICAQLKKHAIMVHKHGIIIPVFGLYQMDLHEFLFQDIHQIVFYTTDEIDLEDDFNNLLKHYDHPDPNMKSHMATTLNKYNNLIEAAHILDKNNRTCLISLNTMTPKEFQKTLILLAESTKNLQHFLVKRYVIDKSRY